MAPYRAILRYYRCDTPYRAMLFKGGLHSPKMVRYPPPLWYLIFHRHICAIPHFATYRARIVRYPIETSRAAKRGVSKGGVSRSGLVLPFLSFLGLSRFFQDFPDLLGEGPGIFPIRPFSFSRPIKSTYEEQSRKGPRHNLDLSRKKRETPRFGNPPV